MQGAEIIGCIPCFNGAGTLATVVQSVRQQSVGEIPVVVIDDGSRDDSAGIAQRAGAILVRNDRNLGRGATRARGGRELKCSYLVFCDVTVVLPPDFLERAVSHFADARVAAVFGSVSLEREQGAVDRWENRHLYRRGRTERVESAGILVTAACVLRRSAVLEVGNFDPALRESEDAELGHRLRRAGFEIRFDPSLNGRPLRADSVSQALERYARWNTAPEDRLRWRDYPRLAAYGLKTMAGNDLRQGDLLSALISAAAPHYQFWRSRFRIRRHA